MGSPDGRRTREHGGQSHADPQSSRSRPARSRIVRPGSGSPSECYRFHSLLAFPAGVAQLITHRYPSERFVAALGPPAPEEIKALIEWGAPSAPREKP